MTGPKKERPSPAEVKRRNILRRRALQTIEEPYILRLKVSGKRAREIVRQLNDTIGMFAYEIIGYDQIPGDMLQAEYCIPGKDLATMLKLEHNGL